MDKRFSQRKSGKILAAAAASVGLAGFASQSHASLLIDVRAIGVTAGQGAVVSPDKKTVSAVAGNLITITMGVFARISGTNATQSVGEFGGGAGDDTRNDDTLQTVVGSFQSVGPLLGNLTTGAAGVSVTPNPRVVPYTASGGTNGTALDWDSDGDLDIGQNGTDPTNMFAGRAAAPSSPTIFNGTTSPTKGWSNGPDGSATSGNNTNDTIIDATTAEIQIGSLRFVTTPGSNVATNVNFVPRPTTDAGSALWFEDGIATGKTPGTGAYLLGAPVNVNTAPEPASLALLGIASLGLLARRREKNSNA